MKFQILAHINSCGKLYKSKLIIPLVMLVLRANDISGQKATVWIAPTYAMEIDTSQWEMLYEAPHPLMTYQYPIAQEIKHRSTGLVVILQAKYAVEEKHYIWLQKMEKNKHTESPLTFEKLGGVSKLDPAYRLRTVLFGIQLPDSVNNLKPFEAYYSTYSKPTFPTSYIWSNSPCHLAVFTKQTLDENTNALFRNVVRSIQLSTPEILDKKMTEHFNTSKNHTKINDITFLELVTGMSHSDKSKRTLDLATYANDLNEIPNGFSFSALHKSMSKIYEDQISLTDAFHYSGGGVSKIKDNYHMYHLSNYRLNALYQQMQLYKTFQQFPAQIQTMEIPYLNSSEDALSYEGYYKNKYYILTLNFVSDSVQAQLDSITFSHFENRDNTIRSIEYGFNQFKDSPVQWEPRGVNGEQFLLTTLHQTVKNKTILDVFDDYYFLDRLRPNKKIIAFIPPAKADAYESFVTYTINAFEQRVIDTHFQSNDTVRYYNQAMLKDGLPAVIAYHGLTGKERQSGPAKRLYQSSIFHTDLNANGKKEYWQLFVSNGVVIKRNFYAEYAVDDSLNSDNQSKKVLQLPIIKNLLATSKSVAINDHQFLTQSGDYIEESIMLSDAQVVDDSFDEALALKIAQDTTVYQYPDGSASFSVNDPFGEVYLRNNLGGIDIPNLNKNSAYKVSFIIEKNGSLSHIQYRHTNGEKTPIIESELRKALSQMPNWRPASSSDIPVRSYGAMYFGIYIK